MITVGEAEVMQYLGTALWSSTTDDESGHGGEPLDQYFTVDSFSDESVERARQDLTAFAAEAQRVIDALERDPNGEPPINMESWPHDFWLTRNGHGAGFWDRPERYAGAADALSSVAERFGEKYVFVNRRAATAEDVERFGVELGDDFDELGIE